MLKIWLRRFSYIVLSLTLLVIVVLSAFSLAAWGREDKTSHAAAPGTGKFVRLEMSRSTCRKRAVGMASRLSSSTVPAPGAKPGVTR